MGDLIKFDYEKGAGWAYTVMERGLDDGEDLLTPSRVLSSCPTEEARDAAYRLLSGKCQTSA